MKCPGCKFICSDLRDLCPKCAVDLREFKERLGLRIINPELSTQQLIEKTFGRGLPTESPVTLLDILRKFLGVSNKAPGVGDRLIIKNELPKKEAISQNVTKPVPTVIEKPKQQAPTSTIETSLSSRSIEDLIRENETFEIQETIVVDTLVSQVEAAPVPEIVMAEVRSEVPVKVARPKILPPIFEETREIDQLFNQAYSEIAFLEKEYLSVEFELSHLRKFEVGEDVKLLFSLAYDSFSEPEVETKQYVEFSKVEELLDTDLQQVLAEASKAVSEAKPRSLARIREDTTGVDYTISPSNPASLVEVPEIFDGAPISLRALALIVDLVFILAIGLVVITNFYISDEFVQRLLNYNFKDDAVYFTLLFGYLLEVLGPVAVLYYIIALAGFGTTLGAAVGQLSIVGDDLKPASRHRLLLRGLVLPASILFFGWIPMIFGRNLLHESISSSFIKLSKKY